MADDGHGPMVRPDVARLEPTDFAITRDERAILDFHHWVEEGFLRKTAQSRAVTITAKLIMHSYSALSSEFVDIEARLRGHEPSSQFPRSAVSIKRYFRSNSQKNL
jgi:hypothetical protein